jgi:hypothetical protein
MAQELQPCGTPAAYRRHLARGEPTCEACCAAMADRQRQYRPVPTIRGPYGKPQCGTDSGHQVHKRRRETPCEPCREAHRAYQQQWRAERRRRERFEQMLAEAWMETA